jgi:hypothetical protein
MRHMILVGTRIVASPYWISLVAFRCVLDDKHNEHNGNQRHQGNDAFHRKCIFLVFLGLLEIRYSDSSIVHSALHIEVNAIQNSALIDDHNSKLLENLSEFLDRLCNFYYFNIALDNDLSGDDKRESE